MKTIRIGALIMILALLCGTLTTALATKYVCPLCDGAGGQSCSTCGGAGQARCGSCGGLGFWRVGETCPNCGGDGKVTCASCMGTGRTTCSFCGGKGWYGDDDEDGGGGSQGGDNGPDESDYVDRPGADETSLPCKTARGTVIACTKGNSANEGVKNLFDGDEGTVYRTDSTSLYVIWKTPKPLAAEGYELVFVGEDYYFDDSQPEGDPPRNWTLYGSPRQLGRNDSGWYEIADVELDRDDSATVGFGSEFYDPTAAFQYFKLEVTKNFGGQYTKIAELRLNGTEKDKVEEPTPEPTCVPTEKPAEPTEVPGKEVGEGLYEETTPEPTAKPTAAPESTATPASVKSSIKKAKITVKDQAYTGKALTPAVTVKLNGAKLKKGTDYTVEYSGNKKVGTATVKVTGKGKYTGSAKATFKINPKKVTGLTLKAGRGKLAVSWKKVSGVTGYQVQYALNKNFKSAKKVTIKKAATVKKTIKNLKAKKTYYVRVRAYQKVNGKTYWSAWSDAAKAGTKE